MLLDRIHEKCSPPAPRIALFGLGGHRKSQLAIEHCYRTIKQSPETWVFWVHASNAARFEESYQDIASSVEVPGRQNPTADVFQLVHDWLRDERNGKWVLVLDNADDARFLLEARSAGRDGPTNDLEVRSSQPLVTYVPQCKNGSVLVTTRSRNVALQLVEECDIVAVEPMDKKDAQALLQKKLGRQDSSEEVIELAAALEFIPLAMVQAAAYISQRRPRCSVQQYLRDFRRIDRKRTSLLDCEGGQLRRDWEAESSVIITWQVSFNHIRDIRPSAADLLALMSFYDRQGIPEALLRNRAEQEIAQQSQEERDSDYNDWGEDEDNVLRSSASEGFEADVLTLRDYSFISVNADGATFEMPSQVQLATRKWLEVHGQLENWKRQFVRNLCEAFPTGEYENWARCQTLFPHAKSAAEQPPKGDDALADWATILHRAAWYAWRMGNGIDAEKMSVQAMNARRKTFGREHQDTLSSMAMVGLAYKLIGRWDAAEALEVEVMEISKTQLGADHPDALTSIANLASTYRNQGRWDAAEALEVEVIEARKAKLGAHHPDMLTIMANLASTYREQGRWEAAEELEVQAMETRKKVLGPEHPDTLTSVSNLGLVLESQGKYEEAEAMQRQALEGYKKVLGPEHPDTLTSVSNLGLVLESQGKYEEAEAMQRQALEGWEKVLGLEHPYTLTSVNNLGSVLKMQGKYEEAEVMHRRALEAMERVLGLEHPYTLTSVNNLGSVLEMQGKYEEAEAMHRRALEAREKT
ncbi:TPR-like protein [Trematosphaeria pertusa]|uniref:TPR-like protein n=1 Tax=Trematosphaeria pertusa TaxID=390896 RepID=A0A6A6HVU4_9PLEO|nr:TPR-like protein [Trematosphaeria pertusa]KAF2242295.1 TPR-like protein [Trematosphaeria pertusa]